MDRLLFSLNAVPLSEAASDGFILTSLVLVVFNKEKSQNSHKALFIQLYGKCWCCKSCRSSNARAVDLCSPVQVLPCVCKSKEMFQEMSAKCCPRLGTSFPGNINPPNTGESPRIILSNARLGNQFCALFFNPEISKEEEEGENGQNLSKQNKNWHCIEGRERNVSLSRAMTSSCPPSG